MLQDSRATNPQTNDPGLSGGERLLIWTWRKIVTGRASCPLIAREFVKLCGEDAAEVLATLSTFLQALAYSGRRDLQIGYPGCPSLTTDERWLLSLIAVAQADDEERIDAHLRWLARATLRPALAIAARALATALKVHGVDLPLPTTVVPLGGRRPEALPSGRRS